MTEGLIQYFRTICFVDIGIDQIQVIPKMQLVLILLWIKISQGLYLLKKRSSDDMTEDYSIINYYNSMHMDKSKEKAWGMLPVLTMDAKPTKRKNMKKYIADGKAVSKAVDDTRLDFSIHKDMIDVYDQSMYDAKFAPMVAVDGYEADDSDHEVELDEHDDAAVKMEDHEQDVGSDLEAMEESDQSDSESNDSESNDSDSSDSTSDSESDEDVEHEDEYYVGEHEYVYSYEWDDSDNQVTGSDYVYSYEWAWNDDLYN